MDKARGRISSRTRSSPLPRLHAGGARGVEGWAHAEPAREPRRGGRSEPSLQPRDAGVERADGRVLPAFPQAVEDYQLLSSPAVADVSDAAGKEVIVGTGLYYLRNINSTGAEGAGGRSSRVAGCSAFPPWATRTATATWRWPRSRARATPSSGTPTDPHAAATTNGGPHATTSGPPAPTAWTVARRARRPSSRYAQRQGGHALVQGAWRRLAVRPGEPLPDRQVHRRDQSPDRRRGGGRLRRRATSGQTETRTVAEIGQKTARVAVLYQDDAGNWGRLASAAVPAPGSASCSAAGTPAGRSAPRAATSSAPRASSCGSRPRFGP